MKDNRFSHDTRELVILAQDQARRLGHPGIGCEHLLFAAATVNSAAAGVLREHGLTPSRIESAIPDALAGATDIFDAVDGEALATIGIDLTEIGRHIAASLGPQALHSSHPRRALRKPRRTGTCGAPDVPQPAWSRPPARRGADLSRSRT
jgi:hypothetical protein